LLEGANLTKADINAWTVSENYKPVEQSSQILSNDGRPVAVVAEFVRGNVAEIRRSAYDANDTVSMAQTFAAGASEIYSKLSQMQQLAERAVNSSGSSQETAVMQQQILQLAEEVNRLAENTEYDGNKIFTAEGEKISAAMGNGSNILLLPRDLRFEAGALDLINEPEAAFARVRSAATTAGEYSRYLAGKLGWLEDVMATYDRELNTMDINSSGFTMSVAGETAKNTAQQIRGDVDTARQIQADVEPERAAYLLRFE
jgi:flagellin